MTARDYNAFLTEYTPLLAQMAKSHWTTNEVYTRFTTMYPTESREHLATALDSGNFTFTGRREQPLNNMMMAAALWYAVAYSLDLEADRAYAAVTLDATLIADIPRSLETAGLTREEAADAMGLIGAALKELSTHPFTSLEESAYKDFIDNLPQALGSISQQKLAWPPAPHIIEERLGDGSWNTALMKVGICPTDSENSSHDIDGSKLTDRSFRNALGDFLSYCIRYDRRPSVLLYGSWSTDSMHLGRVPLLSAIRSKYGSWTKALYQGRSLINDALKVSASSAVPVSIKPETDDRDALSQFSSHGIGIVQAGTKEERNQWADLNQVMFSEFNAIPWGGSLRIYYTDTPENPDNPTVLCARVMRTHAGYLCEIFTDDNGTPLPLNQDYMHTTGWSEPHNGFDTWTQNFFSVADAAYYVVGAVRDGLGCTKRKGYFAESSSPDNATGEPHAVLPE